MEIIDVDGYNIISVSFWHGKGAVASLESMAGFLSKKKYKLVDETVNFWKKRYDKSRVMCVTYDEPKNAGHQWCAFAGMIPNGEKFDSELLKNHLGVPERLLYDDLSSLLTYRGHRPIDEALGIRQRERYAGSVEVIAIDIL